MADEVNVRLDIETADALRALAKTETKIKQFGDKSLSSTKKAELGFANLTKSMFVANLASAAAIKVLSGLSSAFTEAFQESLKFEKALAEVNTLLPKNAQLTKETTKAISNLAVEFGTDKASQAKSFYQIISAGITDQAEATALLGQANKLALGGIASVESSIDLLTNVLNSYGLSVAAAGDVSDVLFKTVELGKTTISELASSLSLVLPSARGAAVSVDEVGAALATMTQQGLSTAQRTTQLRSLFTAIARRGKDMGKGISIAAIASDGLQTVLARLIKRTGGSRDALARLVGRVEAADGILSIAGPNAAKFAANIEKMGERSGATEKAVKTLQETLDFDLKVITAQFSELSQKLIKELTPALVFLTEQVRDFFDIFTDDTPAKRLRQIDTQVQKIKDSQKALAEELRSGGIIASFVAKGSIENGNKLIETLMKEKAAIIAKNKELLKGTGGDRSETIAGGSELDAAVAVQAEKDRILQAGIIKEEEAAKKKLEIARKLAADQLLIAQEFEAAEFDRKAIQQGLIEEAETERLNKLAETLGREEAIRALAEEKSLKRQGKTGELLKKQRANDVKAEKADIFAIQKFEDLSQKQRLSNVQSTLGTISSLTSSSNSTLFAIGKAAAISTATIDGLLGVQKALGSAPPPFNFALAAAVGAASAINVGKIAATPKPSGNFQNGGLIEGSSQTGDRLQIGANAGEGVLTRRGQQNLLNSINNGEGVSGQGSGINVTIMGDVVDNENFIDNLVEKLNDGIEFRNLDLEV